MPSPLTTLGNDSRETRRIDVSSTTTASVAGNIRALSSSALGSFAGSTLSWIMASRDPPAAAEVLGAGAPGAPDPPGKPDMPGKPGRPDPGADPPGPKPKPGPAPGCPGPIPPGRVPGEPPADRAIAELIWAWSVPGRLARRLGTVSLGSPTARKIGPGGRWESACSTSGPGFHPFFLTVSRAARAASEVDEKAMWFPSIRIVGRTPGGTSFSGESGGTCSM